MADMNASNTYDDRIPAAETVAALAEIEARQTFLEDHARSCEVCFYQGASNCYVLYPETEEPEHDPEPNEDGPTDHAYDSEAQADLELHNQLHPNGYRGDGDSYEAAHREAA